MQYSLSVVAVADLEELLDYIAADNPAAAASLRRRLHASCRLLAANPQIGSDRSDLLVGLRSWPVGNYVIDYTACERGVTVVRVLHGARDTDRYFE